MFARSVARLSGHGGPKTTWVTSCGNPVHQFPAFLGFGLAFGGSVYYGFSRMQAAADRLKAKHHHAAPAHH